MEKRDKAEERFEMLKLLHYIFRAQNSSFYDKVFPQAGMDDPDAIEGQTYTVDELPDLESQVIAKLSGKRKRTQQGLDEEWSDWR